MHLIGMRSKTLLKQAFKSTATNCASDNICNAHCPAVLPSPSRAIMEPSHISGAGNHTNLTCKMQCAFKTSKQSAAMCTCVCCCCKESNPESPPWLPFAPLHCVDWLTRISHSRSKKFTDWVIFRCCWRSMLSIVRGCKT